MKTLLALLASILALTAFPSSASADHYERRLCYDSCGRAYYKTVRVVTRTRCQPVYRTAQVYRSQPARYYRQPVVRRVARQPVRSAYAGYRTTGYRSSGYRSTGRSVRRCR